MLCNDLRADGRSTSRRQFLTKAACLGASVLATRLPGADRPLFSIDARLKALMADAPRTMEFGGATPAEAQAWQQAFRGRIEALLGDFRPPGKWESRLEETEKFPDHVREGWILTAPGCAELPVYLLRPTKNGTGSSGRSPGIVAIHGHGLGYDTIVGRADTPEHQAELKRFRYDYGLQLVRRGYVVAAPCLTPFGRRLSATPAADRRDACETTQLRLQLLGKLLLSENLRDILWALDFLTAQREVDAARLGCVGLSYGGRMTMFAAALDPRIKVAVMAGSLNWLQERASTRSVGGCQVVPGLLQFGDVPEITGLIAPRPILWTCGKSDRHIEPEWAERALVRMRNVYRAMGAEKEVKVQYFDGGHEWQGEVAYGVLSRALSP